MAARPEELFPNLFGKKPESAPLPMKPEDLRLLQWSMRQAGTRPKAGSAKAAVQGQQRRRLVGQA